MFLFLFNKEPYHVASAQIKASLTDNARIRSMSDDLGHDWHVAHGLNNAYIRAVRKLAEFCRKPRQTRFQRTTGETLFSAPSKTRHNYARRLATRCTSTASKLLLSDHSCRRDWPTLRPGENPRTPRHCLRSSRSRKSISIIDACKVAANRGVLLDRLFDGTCRLERESSTCRSATSMPPVDWCTSTAAKVLRIVTFPYRPPRSTELRKLLDDASPSNGYSSPPRDVTSKQGCRPPKTPMSARAPFKKPMKLPSSIKLDFGKKICIAHFATFLCNASVSRRESR